MVLRLKVCALLAIVSVAAKTAVEIAPTQTGAESLDHISEAVSESVPESISESVSEVIGEGGSKAGSINAAAEKGGSMATAIDGETNEANEANGTNETTPSNSSSSSSSSNAKKASPWKMAAFEMPDLADAEVSEFKADTGRVMDIIVHSLYTDKDIFIRELVSNAVDALEKSRLRELRLKPDLQGQSDEASGAESAEGELTKLPKDKIVLTVDKARKEMTILDSGIGMCKDELVNNLGTLAKSGTAEFLKVSKEEAAHLIGKFGVGFYSSFLVADRVSILSRCDSTLQKKKDLAKEGDKDDLTDVYLWTSEAAGSFSVKKLEDSVAKDPAFFFNQMAPRHGTAVILHMKDDAVKYLNEAKVKDVMSRFSSFVPFPIYVQDQRDAETEAAAESAPKFAHMNAQKPIWLQDKSQLKEDDYNQFFRVTHRASADPLAHTHFKGEGEVNFKALFYVPSKQERNLYTKAGELDEISESKRTSNIKLYVQRVLVSDKLENFLPPWLSFVSGVIDSNDLPLKVDRQGLTKSRVMRIIKSKSLQKILDLLRSLSRTADEEAPRLARQLAEIREEAKAKRASLELQVSSSSASPSASKTKEMEEKKKELRAEMKEKRDRVKEENRNYYRFAQFWQKFGQNMVSACIDEDVTMNDKTLRKLFGIFRARSWKAVTAVAAPEPASSANSSAAYQVLGDAHDVGGSFISLDTYIEQMKPGQQSIYYLTGDDVDQLLASPYLEFFKANDVDVLLLLGAFDEACFQNSYVGRKDARYRDKTFVSIEKQSFGPDEFHFLHPDFKAAMNNAQVDTEKETTADETAKVREAVDRVKQELKDDYDLKSLYYKPLIDYASQSLGPEQAQAVILSKTLTTSPAIITTPAFGFTASHERMARTSIGQSQEMINLYSKMKNLELNPDSELVHKLLERVKRVQNLKSATGTSAKEKKKEEEEEGEEGDEGDEGVESEVTAARERADLDRQLEMLYETATIAGGFPARRPHILINALISGLEQRLVPGSPAIQGKAQEASGGGKGEEGSASATGPKPFKLVVDEETRQRFEESKRKKNRKEKGEDMTSAEDDDLSLDIDEDEFGTVNENENNESDEGMNQGVVDGENENMKDEL